MSRRPIAPEDVGAQLAFMTETMAEILELIDAGTAVHGRAIAKALEVPYPQAYHTLNVLTARRFLSVEWDDDVPTRKNHSITPAGYELLARVRESRDTIKSRKRRTQQINPDEYARRMRVSSLVTWLIRQGLVSSRQDLEHIIGCSDCERLLFETADGWASQVRCEAHPHNTVNQTGE